MSNSNIYDIKLFSHKREEILNLLSQLTSCTVMDQNRFEKIIFTLKDNHNIYVYIKDDKVVGIITLFIEQKLIHNGSCVAHIEDLVVDKEYTGKGIARELINFCLDKLSSDTHYKIILNCKEELKTFYVKFGFVEKNIQMAKYFI
jgi:glucosamine-phosphate N-acetyltransferase